MKHQPKKPDRNPVSAAPPREETCIIPQKARRIPLKTFPLSTRLRSVLGFQKVKLAGALHGLAFSEFQQWRKCGKKTFHELRELVREIQRAHHAPAAAAQQGVAVQEAAPTAGAGTFFVPANRHDLSVAELPLSVRLEKVLQRKGVRCLGDLHGLRVEDLQAMQNCGAKTLAELTRLIERPAAGEFDLETEAAWSPVELVRTLDVLIADLPGKKKPILVARLGGKRARPLTLEAIGGKWRLTRERVRQIVDGTFECIRRAGSRRLKSYLEHVEKFCCDAVCPLTTSLLAQWVGGAAAAGRFSLAFYVRLLGELRPTIPAWPSGQEVYPLRDGLSVQIEQGLETVLRERLQPLPLREALSLLQTTANLSQVAAPEFLAALHYSGRLKVEFLKPAAPEVRLARVLAADVAKAVLQASNAPLTPEEILVRAESIIGADGPRWSPRYLSRALAEGKGFHLLGPGRYGIRQHFSLPEPTWKQIRANFYKLLRLEKRPISTVEVVRDRRFNWLHQAGAYELAAILRQDARFVNLGKCLFALAEWNI